MQRNQSVLGVASRAVASAAILIVTGVAHAQWTVAYLHPAGATRSGANGGSGTIQVGTATIGGRLHACRWNGTAASFVDMNPAGSVGSGAYAMSDTQEVVGWAWGTTAALWSGSSVVGLSGSVAYDISGAHQVGYEVVSSAGYIFHALLWSGTPASQVDLNPATANSSFAYGIFGTQQVGSASTWDGGARAGLWNGTADSWVELGSGAAYATSGTQQVGYVDLGSDHAALWSGTAASFVDLNPAVATSSSAKGIFGPYQVGYVNLGIPGSTSSASLWSGTGASWENLSLALTGSWSNTVAQSVWSDGTRLYVAGSGHNNSANRDEALLWSRPLPAPCGSADFNHDGDSGTDADIEAFFACIAGNCCAPCGTADFNGDGDVGTDSDIEAFFRVLAGGNC
jgi:hypothetical protein